MKIYLPVSLKAKTGKGFFINRLAKELLQYAQITNENDKHHIALHLAKIKRKTNAIHKIIRYDGVYHNVDQDYKHMNKEMAKYLKQASGVIYQSKFSKIMCEKYLGYFNGPSAIIHNGIDVSSFDKVKPIKSDFTNNIIAVSRWRPHKRLRDIIESFLLANLDSVLWVAGDLKESGLSKADVKKYPKKVKFLGRIDQEILARYYKLCKVSVHLCWFDCCPNSVIEAIAANCVIVSNNVGGTPELTEKSNGIICNIDKKYNLKPVRLYKPPLIDHRIVAKAIRQACLDRYVENQFIDIKNIARQYVKFFSKIC